MSKHLIGIDIGNRDVKFAHPGGRLTVARLPENMVKDDRIVVASLLTRFLREARRKNNIPGGRCAVILPDYSTFFRRLTVPAMTDEQLALNLPYEFRDFTGAASDEYFYDYLVERQNLNEAGEVESIDIAAAAAQKSVVTEYIELFRHSGFKLTLALPREMAFINLLRDAEAAGEPGGERCIIDIGNESTRVYIFDGATLKASRIIECGCTQIDGAISSANNIDEYVAGTWRLTNHENVLDSDACRSVYERISLEVRKAVNFYTYNEPQSELNHIYFCGDGADIAALTDIINADISLETHNIAELMPPANRRQEQSDINRCAMAIGVAL